MLHWEIKHIRRRCQQFDRFHAKCNIYSYFFPFSITVIDNSFEESQNDESISVKQQNGTANMFRTSPPSNVQVEQFPSGSVHLEESTLLLNHTHKKSYKVVRDFLQDINPIVPNEWREKRCHGKVYEIFKVHISLYSSPSFLPPFLSTSPLLSPSYSPSFIP